jgi:hypothetical protein
MIQAGIEPDAPDQWYANLTPPTSGDAAFVTFYEIVDGNPAGHWTFRKDGETWTLIEDNPEGSLSTPPVVPDGFNFFTEPVAYLSLAESQPGAAIFYTINGTAAAPRNPAAAFYVSPFNADSGVTIRARAWLSGYIPSAEKRLTL